MKIVRIDSDVDDITYGAVEPEGIRIYRGTPLVAWEPTETVVAWDRARLLAPVIPTKVVAVGRNYVEHAEEFGNEVPERPLIFLKPPTTVIGPLQAIRVPPETNRMEHEAELAVVMGKVTRRVAVEDVGPHILGYTAANDVTARDLQRSDGQWTRGKGFDTFCPLGPAIDTELDPAEGLSIICRVNDEIRQTGSTSDMVFPVGELVSYISQVMTLLPGDVILTGTPA
ncbi:MAG: fumarylacetoacetate hydrolase family protein, partial [Acidimicrobiia bacterium]|nr:fumarylacetoacetate hydrolase family protein [Acidimicrobiia bacterium]